MRKIIKAALLTLCFGSTLSSLLMAQTEPFSLKFDFKNQASLTEWKNTTGVRVIPSPEGVKLESTNWNVKFYKTVTLSPGKYVLYGRGWGNVTLLLLDHWADAPISHLNLTSQKVFEDYVDVEIPPGEPRSLILCAELPSPDQHATLEWIRLEKAPQRRVEYDSVPTPEELEKSRPNPPIVRGFMMGPDWSMQNFHDAAKLGADMVRLQVAPIAMAKRYQQPIWEAWPKILDEIEQAVKNAHAAGIKVVVDLHQPAIPEIIEKSQFDQPELWRHPELESSFLHVWSDIATRLKPYHETVWGYDLYNEPLDRAQLPWPPKQWYPLAVKLLKTIRQIDPDVWIIFEPGPGGMDRGFNGLVPLPDTKVIYSIHNYDPTEFTNQGLESVGGLERTDVGQGFGIHYPTVRKDALFDKSFHQKSMKAPIDFQNQWHVPIYVGEFSVIRWAPKADAVLWLKDTIDIFETLGWSWSYHAFREFNGWSLECDETYWKAGMPLPKPVEQMTEREKVIVSAFEKNQTGSDKKVP